MKTLLTACLLMLSCVAQAMPPKAPAPLWTAKVASRRVLDSETRPDARIAAAVSEVAVIVSEPGTVTVLEARTGKERWAFQSSPSTPKDRGSRWDVVGTSGDAQGHAVVVLVRADPAPLQVGAQKPQQAKDVFFALHGVEAATGQTLWRKDYVGSPPPDLLMRHGVVLVPTTSRNSNGTYRENWEYLDAQTGEQMELDNPQSRNRLRGRALLRRILLSEGGTILENHVSPARRLRADTGTSETIPIPDVGKGYISPQFAQNGIIVSQAEPFGGFTGHSSWPKYLVGSDAGGREFWRFPAKTAWSKESPDTMGAPESLMRNVAAVPKTEVFLAEDEAGTLYGLRLRDGKPLWKLPSAPFRLPLTLPTYQRYYTPEIPSAIYGAGCFAYVPSSDQQRGKPNTPPHAPTIVYVSALTGKTLPLLFGLPVQQVTVGGDTLFAQTAANTFRAYSLAAFSGLRTVQQQQHEAAMLARTPAAIARLLPFEKDLSTWQTFGEAANTYRMEDGGARVDLATSGSSFSGGIYSLPFAVTSGQSYRFTFDARTDNPKTGFFAGLFHTEADFFHFSEAKPLNVNYALHLSETWQRISVTLHPDKTDIRAALFLGGEVSDSGKGKHAILWIRNISLQAPVRKPLLSGRP